MADTRRPSAHGGLDRREFLKAAGLGAAAVVAGPSDRLPAAKTTPRKTPDILLIITDQQHINSISAGGCKHIRTPAMDALMKRGTAFALSHSVNPVCGPARSAIFTGRTTSETGVHVNGRSIRKGMPNMGQWFSRHSTYETVYAGKWHLPRSFTLSIDGFRVICGGIGGQGNLGDAAASRACEALLRARKSDRPLLMVASFLQPHDICEWLRLNSDVPKRLRYPALADKLPELPANFTYDPAEPASLRKRRDSNEASKGKWTPQHWRYYIWSYYRHVEMVDAEIGRVLRALKDTGRDKDTLVLLTSDHGEGLARHQMVRKSLPYDEALKVPFVISWPGHIPEGKVDTTTLVTGLDVMPTFCDYAGIAPPAKMRGASLRPLLEGRAGTHHGHVVLEMPGDAARVVRTARYKYVTYAGDPVDQLFDMQADPGETKNLARDPARAAAVAEHRKLLVRWESTLDVATDMPSKTAWWRKG